MFIVKPQFHSLEKAKINLGCALDLLTQHFQQVVTLDAALINFLNLANFPHKSPICILAAISLSVDELHHFILTLLILYSKFVAQIFLLLKKLVVDLDVERVAKQKRISTRAGTHGFKPFLVLLQNGLQFANETLALHFL